MSKVLVIGVLTIAILGGVFLALRGVRFANTPRYSFVESIPEFSTSTLMPISKPVSENITTSIVGSAPKSAPKKFFEDCPIKAPSATSTFYETTLQLPSGDIVKIANNNVYLNDRVIEENIPKLFHLKPSTDGQSFGPSWGITYYYKHLECAASADIYSEAVASKEQKTFGFSYRRVEAFPESYKPPITLPESSYVFLYSFTGTRIGIYSYSSYGNLRWIGKNRLGFDYTCLSLSEEGCVNWLGLFTRDETVGGDIGAMSRIYAPESIVSSLITDFPFVIYDGCEDKLGPACKSCGSLYWEGSQRLNMFNLNTDASTQIIYSTSSTFSPVIWSVDQRWLVLEENNSKPLCGPQNAPYTYVLYNPYSNELKHINPGTTLKTICEDRTISFDCRLDRGL